MKKNRHILIFKTSVDNRDTISRISCVLDGLIAHGGRWNFDLDDCDRILKIVNPDVSSGQVERMLEQEGVWVKELED